MRKLLYIKIIVLQLVVNLIALETIIAQGSFKLPPNRAKVKIPFELVNNLVIVPVTINGSKLSFLLDTGVSSSLLFALGEHDSLQLNNAKPIKIKGLGQGDPVDALSSEGNTFKIGDAIDTNHKLFVVMDKKLNFSTRMGVPVHGILGFDLFKDFVVQTDYSSKRLTLYPNAKYKRRKCRNCIDFPIAISGDKPYVELQVDHNFRSEKVTVLVDSGSSDAIWLFDEEGYINEDTTNYFFDFLGLGLSGDIFGKRSKIGSVSFGDYKLENVTVAFPNDLSLGNLQFFEERDGSLGGEILKRFTVIMDYASRTMTLKRNSNFNAPFYYNMSGITLEHDGLIPVKDVQKTKTNSLNLSNSNDNFTKSSNLYIDPSFIFFLAPKFVVAELREGSPAALAGVKKGDEVISVNGKPAYKYKLHELVEIFSSKPGRRISMVINRNGYDSKIKFTLQPVL